MEDSRNMESGNNDNNSGEKMWKSFIFKPAGPDNYQDILNHMRTSFYRDEPLNQLVGYSEDKAKDMDAMISEYFQDRLSHIVVERETNQVRTYVRESQYYFQ